MKQKLLLLAFVIPFLICAADEQDQKLSAAEVAEAEALAQQLIEKYKPTKETCDFGQKLLLSKEGTLACILSGNKNVFWGAAIWYKNFPENIKQLMREKNIKTLDLAQKNEMIWYSPTGEQHALLLQKYLNDYFEPYLRGSKPSFEFNPYLVGFLLGYSDDEMKNHQYGENFEQDKKDAQEWVVKNTIE